MMATRVCVAVAIVGFACSNSVIVQLNASQRITGTTLLLEWNANDRTVINLHIELGILQIMVNPLRAIWLDLRHLRWRLFL